MFIELFGWLGTASLILAGFPQLLKVIKDGHAAGMHLWYLLLVWFGLVAMGIYVLCTTISIQLLCSYGIQLIVFSIILFRKFKPKEEMLH